MCGVNIILLLFVACSIILPASMTAQDLSRSPARADSGTIVYAKIRTNRIGINSDTIDVATRRIQTDSTESGIHFADHYRHAVIGGFFGALGGAVIGGAAGAWIDAHPTTDDAMLSATALLGIYGAIGGLALGLLIGVAWPVK
jgi:hypothetical protein